MIDYALDNGENGEVHSELCNRVEKMILDVKENAVSEAGDAEYTPITDKKMSGLFL